MWLPESRRCGARGWTLCAISTFPSHCSRSLLRQVLLYFFVRRISHSLGRESATEDPEQFMNCYLNPLSLLVFLTVDASSAETLQSIITSSKTLAMEFTSFLSGSFLIWFFKLGFLRKQIWCGYAVCVSALLTFGLVATQQHLAKKHSSTNALKLPEVLWKWAAW